MAEETGFQFTMNAEEIRGTHRNPGCDVEFLVDTALNQAICPVCGAVINITHESKSVDG